MNIVPIHHAETQALAQFLAACGPSLDSFRYFASRPLSIVKDHLVTLLAITEEGVPVAYGHLDPEAGKVWLGICVADECRGRGYGSHMMKALVESAQDQALTELYLTVDKENLAAIKLYEKFGFQLERELDEILRYHLKFQD